MKSLFDRILQSRCYDPDDSESIGSLGDLKELQDGIVDDIVDDTIDENVDDEDDKKDDDVDENEDDKKDEDKKDEDENEDDEDKDKDEDEDDKEDEVDNDTLVTQFSDIKKEFPEFFKKFPDIRAALVRDAKYSEYFASPEDAQEASSKAVTMDAISNDVIGEGNITKVLDIVEKDNKESFEKIALSILPYLNTKNKDLYLEVCSLPIKQLLRAAFKQGGGKTSDLGKAALYIHQYFFDNLNLDSKVKAESSLKSPEKSQAQIDYEKRLEDLNTREHTAFKGSVDESYVKRMDSHIREGLDKDDRLTEYMKKNLVNDTLLEIRSILDKDSRYKVSMNRLWDDAVKGKYTSDSKSKIVHAALTRAKSLVPKIRQRLVSEALSTGKKAKDNDTNKEDKKSEHREIKESKDIPRRENKGKPVSDMDLLSSKIMGSMSETQVVGTEVERINQKKILPKMFDLEDTFYSKLEKSAAAQPVSNRAMRIPLKLRPGGRFGHFSPANSDMGLGSGPSYDKATITVAHLKYAMQWDKLVEWSTDSDRKAIVNAYQDMLAGAMPEFRRAVNSLCMTGGNGVLGTITSVSNANGNDTYTCTTDGFGVKLLRYDQAINVYDTTLATNRTASGEAIINFYDLPNAQIKVPTVAGAIAGDKLVVSGVSGASPVSLLGVPYHNTNASTGTWLGFDRSTTPEIRANRVNASGALALPFPRLAMNKIGDRVGEQGLNKSIKAFMHPCQVAAYEALGQLVNIIQKQAKDENLDLYFGDGMQMAGAPVVPKLFMWDKTRIDFLPMELWGRAEMHAASFYEVGGRKIFEVRGASGGVQTSQLQYLTVSFNIFNQNPSAMAYIDGLTVPSGY